jgi:hypothetical protein
LYNNYLNKEEMEKITSSIELKNAIILLESEQLAKGLLIKEQLTNINPLNLIKRALKDGAKSPGIIENVIVGGVGLAAGYLTRIFYVGSSANIFRKLLGVALQFGATSVVTQNAPIVKSLGQLLLNLHLANNEKKKSNSA